MDRKTNVDHGWNDPPMLNYSPNNPPPKSRITNKRVAFPISSNNSPKMPVSPTLSSLSVPPGSLTLTRSEDVSSVETSSSNKPSGSLSQDQNLPQFLEKCEMLQVIEQSLSTYLCKEDMIKFSHCWHNNEFSEQFHIDVFHFFQSIGCNNKSEIEARKLKLLSEYKSACEPWLNNMTL